MKRVHVFEFEDAAWFPSWLRSSVTNVIVVLNRVLGVPQVLGWLVARLLAEQRIDHVVDLGSGAGGVMPDVLERVRQHPETADARLVMTDLYPNPDAIKTFNDSGRMHTRYEPEPVDARDLASAPRGLKTMVNCFHHMRPEEARRILASAQETRQPLLIYEMGENRLPFALWCLSLPIGPPMVGLTVLVLTPFVRPLTVRQLFFTYVVPLIPISYAWDGQASMPRLYAFEDLEELLSGLGSPDYRWEKGYARTARGRKIGTYLLGCPGAGHLRGDLLRIGGSSGESTSDCPTYRQVPQVW